MLDVNPRGGFLYKWSSGKAAVRWNLVFRGPLSRTGYGRRLSGSGTETNALMLAWALAHLRTPGRADRIRHEASAVFGVREPGLADQLMLSYTRTEENADECGRSGFSCLQKESGRLEGKRAVVAAILCAWRGNLYDV
jgi:hypothetical protein